MAIALPCLPDVSRLAEPIMLWKLLLPEHSAQDVPPCRLDQVANDSIAVVLAFTF